MRYHGKYQDKKTHIHLKYFQEIIGLTPFWNAIEWIWMILFRLKSKLSSRCKSQKIPSGTDVSEFPDKSRTFRDVANVCRSSLRNSDMKLSKSKEIGMSLKWLKIVSYTSICFNDIVHVIYKVRNFTLHRGW